MLLSNFNVSIMLDGKFKFTVKYKRLNDFDGKTLLNQGDLEEFLNLQERELQNLRHHQVYQVYILEEEIVIYLIVKE